MRSTPVRLFQVMLYGWLAFYLLAMLLLGADAWTNAPVTLFHSGNPLLVSMVGTVNAFSAGTMMVITLAACVLALILLQRHRWWLGLLVWFLFRMITHRTWLASNGGIQLMENMLIWGALMGHGVHPFVATIAFWTARLQLLLVYAVAAAHKFTGTAWPDGTAVLMVAHDPAFHLGWLIHAPVVCTALTWGALAFMALFPFAVWWRPTRRLFLVLGLLFHLSTALFMDIPQMGFAFVACYALWVDEEQASRILHWRPRFWTGRVQGVTSPPSPDQPR